MHSSSPWNAMSQLLPRSWFLERYEGQGLTRAEHGLPSAPPSQTLIDSQSMNRVIIGMHLTFKHGMIQSINVIVASPTGARGSDREGASNNNSSPPVSLHKLPIDHQAFPCSKQRHFSSEWPMDAMCRTEMKKTPDDTRPGVPCMARMQVPTRQKAPRSRDPTAFYWGKDLVLQNCL